MSQDGSCDHGAKTNAKDPTRLRRPSTIGVPQRRFVHNSRLRICVVLRVLGLIKKAAQAQRCGKTRSDERPRTVNAVGDQHCPQADRKRDAPNHLYLAWARANSASPVVGALSAARARGRLRSPIHRAPESQQMLTQRSAARPMAASDKSCGVTDLSRRSQRAARTASCALIGTRLGSRQCIISTHPCHGGSRRASGSVRNRKSR